MGGLLDTPLVPQYALRYAVRLGCRSHVFLPTFIYDIDQSLGYICLLYKVTVCPRPFSLYNKWKERYVYVMFVCTYSAEDLVV